MLPAPNICGHIALGSCLSPTFEYRKSACYEVLGLGYDKESLRDRPDFPLLVPPSTPSGLCFVCSSSFAPSRTLPSSTDRISFFVYSESIIVTMKLTASFALSLAYAANTALALPSVYPEPPNLLARNNGGSKIPDLLTVTLDELASGLSAGQFTSAQLVQAYLARIQQAQPILRAVIETNPYALDEAEKYDSERKEGKAKGKLFGIPILIKDNIATARPDQTYMNTTAGSYALVRGALPLRVS